MEEAGGTIECKTAYRYICNFFFMYLVIEYIINGGDGICIFLFLNTPITEVANGMIPPTVFFPI